MTAHEALTHPWIADMDTPAEGEEDLLPTVKKNFNARRTLHAAIDTIRAINQLRAGGAAGMMEGVMKSAEPRRGPPPNLNVPQPAEEGSDPMEIDSLDGRGMGHGQTEEMIKAQERKIRETQQGLWGRR